MELTRAQWFDKLPEKIKSAAYINTANDRTFPEIVMDFKFPSLEKALLRAFDFQTSKEKHDFWWNVIEKHNV